MLYYRSVPTLSSKSAAADKLGVAAAVAPQQADDKRPASISKRASSRSKSAPRSRELPSADKKSEAAAKGRKTRPQPGHGTQVIYIRQLTLQLAQKLMMCRQHTLCMSVPYPDDPVKIPQIRLNSQRS